MSPPRTERLPWPIQMVVMDLDGGHRSKIHMPDARITDMPDSR